MHVPVVTRLVPGAAAVAGLWAVLLAAGIAGAAPAAAVDDPARPDARVTHGPSCRPGGVVVEVTGGAVGYTVTLATTRRPAGEDEAEVAPGAVVVLSTDDVDWGEHIDPDLLYTSLDGADSYVDGLEGWSFTRPAAEDCAAIAPPAADAGVPGTPPALATPVPAGGLEAAPLPGATAPDAPVVPAADAAALPVPDGGTSWPLVVTGSALLVAAVGLLRAAGRRRTQPSGSPPPGSA
ncbi:hypothetical protein [Geodermatophilus sp. CPCC 206100]|uniref:hypothetical protein n=1 Tax=Geodermatophilus sp. CPCC 206100 TaxID=3020054 RepID=UPI003B00A778